MKFLFEWIRIADGKSPDLKIVLVFVYFLTKGKGQAERGSRRDRGERRENALERRDCDEENEGKR